MSDTNLAVQSFALNDGWLEADGANITPAVSTTPQTTFTASNLGAFANNTGTSLLNTQAYSSAYYPQRWWCYPTAERRPIRLGLSEVEKLRSAAKRDAKLKKILEKFTDQIEVVVDFK